MIRLYDYWISSSAWRVRIALHLKGLPFETVSVDLFAGAQHEGALPAANPQRQVPVLEHLPSGPEEGLVLSQSLAILSWLDHHAPEPALFPTEPVKRARAIQLAEIVNAGIQPLQNRSVQLKVDEMGADGNAFARHFIARGLAALERQAAPLAGAFLVGDTVSIADLYLVPELDVARRLEVPLDGLPTLLAVEERCVALPAFAAAHPRRQPDAPAT